MMWWLMGMMWWLAEVMWTVEANGGDVVAYKMRNVG